MRREGRESMPGPEFNPFEAPRVALGPGKTRHRPPDVFPGDVTRPLSITYDMTEDDLRRLPDFDAFYDPLPLFGFIPQWVYVPAILTLPASLLIAIAGPFRSFLGGLIAGPVFYGLMLTLLVKFATANRRAVLDAGLCEGRTATISPRGLLMDVPNAGSTRFITPVAPLVEGFTPWGKFRKVEISEDDVTFWMKGRRRFKVPRHVFPTVAEADTFFEAASWWHADATR